MRRTLELIVSYVLETRHCLVIETFNFKKYLDNSTRLAIATQESAIISLLFCTNFDDHLESNM